MKTAKVSDKVVVGAQPSADDLVKLREQGITTVVNLRAEGEQNQPLSPSEEAHLTENMGLSYHHVPVSLSALDRKQVDEVRAAIRSAQGPVFLHCGAGQRACAIALLADESGDGSDDLISRADAAGFPVSDPQLRTFIERLTRKEQQN